MITLGLGTLDEKEIGRQFVCRRAKPCPNYSFRRISRKYGMAPDELRKNGQAVLAFSFRGSKWHIALGSKAARTCTRSRRISGGKAEGKTSIMMGLTNGIDYG